MPSRREAQGRADRRKSISEPSHSPPTFAALVKRFRLCTAHQHPKLRAAQTALRRSRVPANFPARFVPDVSFL
jgi:hypothetical protein